MIGLMRTRNELFCDLKCDYCQGFREQGCLLGTIIGSDGNEDLMVPMMSIMLRCFERSLYAWNMFGASGVWKHLIVLSKENRPEVEFLAYKKETLH